MNSSYYIEVRIVAKTAHEALEIITEISDKFDIKVYNSDGFVHTGLLKFNYSSGSPLVVIVTLTPDVFSDLDGRALAISNYCHNRNNKLGCVIHYFDFI